MQGWGQNTGLGPNGDPGYSADQQYLPLKAGK